MSLLTLKIASHVALFHRSHSEGWKLLGGSDASLITFGNQIWSGQKGVTIITSPSHFTSLPRTSCIIFWEEKAYLWSLAHFIFRAHHPEAFLSGNSATELLGHFECPLACKYGYHWSSLPFEQSLAGMSP